MSRKTDTWNIEKEMGG